MCACVRFQFFHSLFAYFRDQRLIMKGLKEKRERYFLMMKRQRIIHN